MPWHSQGLLISVHLGLDSHICNLCTSPFFLFVHHIATTLTRPPPTIIPPCSVVIPKSASKSRIEENSSVFGWRLEARHVVALDGLDKGRHVCWSPEGVA